MEILDYELTTGMKVENNQSGMNVGNKSHHLTEEATNRKIAVKLLRQKKLKQYMRQLCWTGGSANDLV